MWNNDELLVMKAKRAQLNNMQINLLLHGGIGCGV